MCWSKINGDLWGSGGGAGFLKITMWIVECVGQRLTEMWEAGCLKMTLCIGQRLGAVGVWQAVASQVGASCSLVSSIFPALEQSTGGTENLADPNTNIEF